MNLIDLVPSLKRTVAGPGEFDTYFPDSDDTGLAGTLADASAEAQLDGFLRSRVVDPDALTIEADPNAAEQALILIYGAARILYARIANLKSMARYKAGPVEAETEQAATVLTELLKQMATRKKQLLDDLKNGVLVDGDDGLGPGTQGSGMFFMYDLYLTKSLDLAVGYYG